jgi:2-polyprenyl-3-methyl-5-hydroxy-6-metoxy-1,4-benzoquinol methylase
MFYDECPVCGGKSGEASNGYSVCPNCRHQWKASVVESEIVNEVLDVRKMLKLDLLTKAKMAAVSKFSRGKRSLLDFGAGSGKFLFFESKNFRSVEGVEITPACIEFAMKSLGVSLSATLPADKKFDVVTAWHSLEHVPPHQLVSATTKLSNMAEDSLIVSVPNAASWLYRMFGRNYAFFDDSSHHHQFTTHSMRALLKQVGWRNTALFQIMIYSIFCYAQTLTNVCTQTHNVLYYALKRGDSAFTDGKFVVAFHVVVFLLFLPLALLLTVLERSNLSQAACLNVACRK